MIPESEVKYIAEDLSTIRARLDSLLQNGKDDEMRFVLYLLNMAIEACDARTTRIEDSKTRVKKQLEHAATTGFPQPKHV